MTSRTLRSLLAALLLSVLMAGSSAAAEPIRSAAGATPSHAAGLGSTRKVALGISAIDDRNPAEYQRYVSRIGVAPATWSIWSDWGGADLDFPSGELMDALAANGTVPIIFWQPVNPANLNGGEYTYDKIVNGDWDDYIRTWATAAAAWGRPVIVRFAHEMDGGWFPWGVRNHPPNTPELFVAAWQHIWNIFKGPDGVGASNAQFLWSPINPCICRASLYPGDAYVEYVGFTAFNWGPPKKANWVTMRSMYQGSVHHLFQLAPTKKIIVAETGTTPVGGGNRAAWIRTGYPAVFAAFPKIKAIVYFDIDMRGQGQPDWRLTKGALTAYKRIAILPQYMGRLK